MADVELEFCFLHHLLNATMADPPGSSSGFNMSQLGQAAHARLYYCARIVAHTLTVDDYLKVLLPTRRDLTNRTSPSIRRQEPHPRAGFPAGFRDDNSRAPAPHQVQVGPFWRAQGPCHTICILDGIAPPFARHDLDSAIAARARAYQQTRR